MDAPTQLLRGQPWSVGNYARAGDGGVQADSAVFSALSASSSVPRRFDRGDVDLSHLHHRLERALGGRTVGIGYCVQQRRAAIEAEAGHSKYGEFDREHLSLGAGRVIARGVVNGKAGIQRAR